MKKVYMGVRLRRLREQQGLTQAALARLLGLSASYLNQMEQNQRPLTVPVLLKLNAAFGTDVQLFSDEEELRFVGDLRAALGDQGAQVSLAEIREIATNMPEVARAVVQMQARLREATERAELLAGRLSGHPVAGASPMAFEAVRDYFYERRNYIAVLDEAAEVIGGALTLPHLVDGLSQRLAELHGVRVALDAQGGDLRRYDASSCVLHLSPLIRPAQQAFQIATQLAFLEQQGAIDSLASEACLQSEESTELLRIGLANYFAGAVILPYRAFLEAAESECYDIELLAQRFDVGFETTCHRLSTLQRPEARGVPFFFIRVDRAGNISKRQSATDFHFSRIGGSCPLWGIYEAFSRPGEVLRQIAQMPDGRCYLWVARTVRHCHGGYGGSLKTFAVALGCDLVHAERLVYARGLDLRNPALATPIGAGCKVCERSNCAQRAFPLVGRTLTVRSQRSGVVPYSTDA